MERCKQIQRGPTWLVGFLLCLGCLSWTTTVYANADRKVQEGEQIQLEDKDRLFFELQVKQQGEFRIETSGESDTSCRLYDRWRGLFAHNDDGGSSKNCRLDQQLSPGSYRLEIRVKKGSLKKSKLHFLRYETSQNEVLKAGEEQKTTLKRLQYNTYRLEIAERRSIKIYASGPTVHHCRLFDAKGWSVGVETTATHLNFYDANGYYRACHFNNILEPGVYQLAVYGDTSRSAPRGKSSKEAEVFAFFGESFLKQGPLQVFTLHADGTRDFTFSLPTSESDPYLLLRGESDYYFSVYIYELNALGQKQYRQHCSARRIRRRGSYLCSRYIKIQSGKRYQISVTGPAYRDFALSYAFFPPQKSRMILGKTLPAITHGGISGYYEGEVKQNDEYAISAKGLGQTCLLRDAKNNELIQARTLPLPEKSVTTQRASLQKEGLTEWIYLSKPGIIQFETHGTHDTICTLLNDKGTMVKRDDDGGQKRNCKINQKIDAGLYNIRIQIYRNRSGGITWSRRLIPAITGPQTKPHADHQRIQEGPCSFHVALKRGVYALHVGDPGNFRIGSVSFHRASANVKEQQDIATLFKPKALPTQAPAEQTFATIKEGYPASFALEAREQRSFVWNVRRSGLYRIETQGLVRTSCALQTPSFPTLFQETQNGPGYNCVMIQYLPTGTYRLRIASQGESHGHLRLHTQRLRMFGAKRMTPGARQYARLSPRYGRYHRIRLPESDNYTLQAFSHDDQLFCRLEAQGNWPVMSGKACNWRGHLDQGSYALWIFPTSRDVRYRSMIYSSERKSDFWPLPDSAYGAQASTFNGNNSADRDTPTNDDELRDHEDTTPSRVYRRHRRYRRYRRPSSPLMQRIQASVLEGLNSVNMHAIPLPDGENKEKAINLPLYGLYKTSISPLGADTYTLKVPVEMELQATLNKDFTGRVFAGQRFVAELKNGGGTFRVAAGTYRLAVQHNENKTQVDYEIGLAVKESAPNTWLWRNVPSTLQIRLAERSRLDIQTEGDPDVWCKLSHTKTQKVIQENDNMSYKRWDCRISELLPAGTYTLEIKGLGKGTWLSLKSRPFGKDHALSSVKTTPLGLDGAPIEGLRFQIKEMSAVQLTTKSRKQLGCALENAKSQEVLGVSGGRRCSLFRLLGPGDYRWRVRSLYAQKHRAYAQLKSLKTQTLLPEKTLSTTSQRRRPAYILFEIKHNGTYTLKTKGPKAYCGLVPRNGKLSWVNCNQALNLEAGWYLWWLEATARRATTIQASLEEVPFEPLKRFDLQLKANQTKHIQLSLAKEGFYNIEIRGEGSTPWGCSLGAQNQIWPAQQDDLRCQLVTYLKAGKHQLHLWRPSEGPADVLRHGSLVVKPLEINFATTKPSAFSGQITTQKLSAKHQAHYVFPAWQGLQAQINLHGPGFALLLDKQKETYRVLASCQNNEETQSCRWSVPLQKQQPSTTAVLAFVAGATPLYYSVSAREISAAPIHLGVNTTYTWGSSRTKETLRVPLQLPLPKSSISAHGRDISCQLQLGEGRYLTGCKQRLDQLQGKGTFVVITNHDTGRITLARDGETHQALWSAGYPHKIKSLPALSNKGQRFILRGKNAYFQYKATSAQIFQLQASGQSLVCAIGRVGQAAQFTHSSPKGCNLALPIAQGDYWIGVRSQNKLPLHTEGVAHATSPQIVKEGRHGPYLLSHDADLWFGVDLNKKTRVGIGLVARHEQTRCTLYNNAMQPVSRACMSYETLPAGRYWLKARLQRHAKPSSAHIVVRGLHPPPKTPPSSYLRKLMEEQTH